MELLFFEFILTRLHIRMTIYCAPDLTEMTEVFFSKTLMELGTSGEPKYLFLFQLIYLI